MSQCIVPNWNLRKEQDEGEAGKRSSHVHTQHPNLPIPMANYDQVAELIWENGHLATHGLGGPAHLPSTKPTFNAAAGGKGGDTLESLVHQATHHKHIPGPSSYSYHCKKENMSSVAASSAGKWVVGDSLGSSTTGKRHQKAEQSQQNQETETNTTTWTSFDSHGNLMQQAMSADEDSPPACLSELKNADDERENKTENGRSFSTRRSRATSVHNQSERKRRDRINQKLKALQKLVPNARKTDKASMLDEVIEYLKQLQAQLKMMSQLSNMSHHQMMMPLGMQQQLQMSLLARMRMGMGMLDHITPPPPPNPPTPHQTMPSLLHSTSTGPTPTFLSPSFLIPSFLSAHHSSAAPLPDSYGAFLTQSMNVDMYNKMASLYQQQINQTTQVGPPLHGTNGPRG